MHISENLIVLISSSDRILMGVGVCECFHNFDENSLCEPIIH